MPTANSREDLMERGLSGREQGADNSVVIRSTEPASPSTSATLTQDHSENTNPNNAEPARKVFGPRRWWGRKGDAAPQAPIKSWPPIVRSYDEAPDGYPRLAVLLDSDHRFMLYRRFGFLQTRLLLHKQDELRALEEELDSLDNDDVKNNNDILFSRVRDERSSGKRKALMAKIEAKFIEYTSILTVSRDLATFGNPIARDYFSLKKYFDVVKPICFEESYIYHQEDIVTLMPSRDTTWLDDFIEKIFVKCQCKLTQKIFSPKRRAQKADPENGVILYSRRRIDVIVTLIVLTIITVLLILPVYLVWHLSRNAQSITLIIIVLLLSTLLFSLVLLKFTRAKRHEILAAAAAYCAVLVTFMGNVGQLNSNTTLGAST